MTEPHILIAEDEPAIRKLLATILERCEFTVTTATDGADVLRQLAAGAKPDVLLLDLMMPNVSGFGVLAELERQKHPLAERIIVLTAASDREVGDLPPSARHPQTVRSEAARRCAARPRFGARACAHRP